MYRIKNWARFQHYKDRNPPWIKLHYDLLSSQTWVMLSDASRVLAIACMLVASRHDGEIPSEEYLKRVAYINGKIDIKPLIDVGFLECLHDASMMLADASSSVSVSFFYSESEKGGVGGKTKPPEIELPDCIPKELWDEFLIHRKQIKKPMTELAQKKTISQLVEWHGRGHDIAAIINESIRNNWRGLFEPKGKHNGNLDRNTATGYKAYGQHPAYQEQLVSHNGAVGSRSIHTGSKAASDYRKSVLADVMQRREEARRNANLASGMDTQQ